MASRNHASFGVALPARWLEMKASCFFDDELNVPLKFQPEPDARSPHGQSITSMVSYLLALFGTKSKLSDSAFEKSALKDLIALSLLSSLPGQFGAGGSSPGALPSVVPRTVKRAEDYMHAHANELITFDDIVREAGCSGRALQNAFQSFRGTTPMKALREIRLDHARHDLQSDIGSVAEIAFKWGFSNLGRFAAQYSAKYGERPHETAKVGSSRRHVERSFHIGN
ncbi:MAG: hypothetical protein Pars93KO_28260 [Parasphingorhabdus sp.]